MLLVPVARRSCVLPVIVQAGENLIQPFAEACQVSSQQVRRGSCITVYKVQVDLAVLFDERPGLLDLAVENGQDRETEVNLVRDAAVEAVQPRAVRELHDAPQHQVARQSSVVPSINSFDYVITGVVTPLFLIAGTFFPIGTLPGWVGFAAHLNPLYHCVELVRHAVFGLRPLTDLGHLGGLVLFAALTWIIAVRGMRRRLID